MPKISRTEQSDRNHHKAQTYSGHKGAVGRRLGTQERIDRQVAGDPKGEGWFPKR